MLWLTWLTVENHFDLFETFEKWGVKGVKIDFMNRSDQWMVNFYERVAREAAKHHLFVDFHGAFKPAGLEYKYPNVLSLRRRERHGADGWMPSRQQCLFPLHTQRSRSHGLYSRRHAQHAARGLPFERPNSASIGTRAYQMALFVLFETGLQMMANNPYPLLPQRRVHPLHHPSTSNMGRNHRPRSRSRRVCRRGQTQRRTMVYRRHDQQPRT